MVQVTDIEISDHADRRTLSGRIDGREARFTFPVDAAPGVRGEPFLSLALLRAMARREALVIAPSAPLDPRLMANLDHIQAILTQWMPDLARSRVDCSQAPAPARRGVLASFSGGVDSSSTLLEHRAEITHLLTLNAFDDTPDEFERLKAKVAGTARELALDLIPVETNVRELCETFSISWNLAHGPVLCLIASTLGFKRFYIPSSYTYRDLKPWGSHPVLDPLWGTSATEIVYDGAHRSRTQKIEHIARDPTLLSQLQVCWNSQVENCGRCSKCARTMLVLETLRATGSPFPSRPVERLIDAVTLKSDLGAAFGVDLIDFFERRGRPQLARRMRARLRRFRVKQHARRLIRDAVGAERVARIRRRLKPDEEIKAVRLQDPDDVAR